MLFNSFIYLLFFPLVCIIYWLLPTKFRNAFLLLASYYFYMSWKPLYGILILFISLVTWWLSNRIDRGENKKKLLLISALLVCFGLLFIFKYANFTASVINELMMTMHIRMHVPFLDLLLPVGISFYTFQAVGYIIDVYKGQIKAEKNFFTYALFLSFFPQLVAGPIERAKNLLPQFHVEHRFSFENLAQGLRLILWGYFMKVVIADRLSVYVDAVYNNAAYHTGTSLLLATLFFTFQIYCDFGGYSNIAIGCAKMMGFNLMTNFRRPYLANSVADFWRRWHISLSTWFKDYLYIPLGGNRCSKWRNYYNLLVTFVVSGIWHGANWTFMIWGALNGIFQIAGKMFKFLRFPKVPNAVHIFCTFVLVSMTWIFFRANNVSDAFLIIKKILFDHGALFTNNIDSIIYGTGFIIALLLSDIFQERNDGKHILLENKYAAIRYVSYIFLTIVILMFGVFNTSQFIYFQF